MSGASPFVSYVVLKSTLIALVDVTSVKNGARAIIDVNIVELLKGSATSTVRLHEDRQWGTIAIPWFTAGE